jgi:hypothetical protein
MYVWNLRDPPNNVPQAARQVWIYAVVTDGTNTTVARGGSLVLTHTPHILLKTRMPDIFQGDLVRLEWDDYMVDDASSTDDAYIRLYASRVSGRTTLQSLEENIQGGGGTDDTFIINSSDGTASGTLTAIRESGSNGFVWDTLTNAFTLPQGSYFIYAGINGDATFSDNTTAPLSQSSNELVIKANNGTNPNLQLSPSKALASVGDTLTFEVVVQSGGAAAELISVVLDMGTGLFTVVNPTSPFTDLGEVFSGGSVVEDTTIATQIRYSKSKAGGETVGAVGAPARLASFQLLVLRGLTGLHTMGFDGVKTAMTIVGSSVPLKKSTGMSVQEAKVEPLARGRLFASVRLEGRAPPVGNGDHATLLDVHLRLPGSTVDIGDATYKASNDAAPATPDTVEVQTNSGGDLTLVDIPAGRYVLTVKDTSHLSGRTDTLVIRNGEAINLSSAQGFFASDIRGDPSFLLDQDGSELAAGDVTEDNEIDVAWGTDNSKPLFKQADLNNDERVGVDDLTVTSSNISNSTGFGAPPVFKRAAGDNQDAGVEVLAPGFVGEWRRGEEVEWVVLVHDLADLAGYGLVISYDPEELELLGAAD